MEMIKKVLYCEGHYFSWKRGDLHTEFGVVIEGDIKKARESVKSNVGKEFKILEPNFVDLLRKAKRGPQIITNKDIGLILTETGIDKESTVLEAGSGSGFLTCNLARFVKKVVSYERREDFLKIATENAALLSLENISFKLHDIYESIEGKNLDLIVLDLPEPWKAIEHSFNALKQGAFFVAYLPSIIQVAEFIKEAEKRFIIVKISEILEREWHVEPQRVRPASQMIAHTGFLCFLRKI